MEKLLDSLEGMQARIGALEAYSRMRRFMVAYLSSVTAPLPLIVRDALEAANLFDHKLLTDAGLEERRVACWSFLDQKPNANDLADQETCLIRAIICALYVAPPDDDICELVTWFLALTKKAGIDDDGRAEGLLKRFIDE